jgi:dienelactone hydrolase
VTRIVTRGLKEEKDGIEGYIAHPERGEKGPGLLLIHQHSGLTGYLKNAAYKFAQLGYTTVIPNLYHMLGYPAEQHIDTGTEIQNKTPDPDFVRVIDRGWRYCLSRNDVDGSRVGVIGYCMGAGSASTSARRHRRHAPSSLTIPRCGKRSRQKFARAILTTPRGKSNARRWCSLADRIAPALSPSK